ncbi:MAG: sulfurtransferase [gamma proteobacterium symbiont of Bathyaustriella thionipta]|nr:sulfurtransferase [gamma proteobacterium symbiont of Bathyaustriella thionipta]MCU7950838.1 sulfurtransferase [gamma proteobacterium symbiont of Bathyaustriella thionipta]MCU7952286.1 sulfurtransferase [gamma proteobacterium symbiont of Bathyaustriella thionipta]MCU7957360.1 sulfurtransferase [gamma proteobacterium symbiont of Bathyaustriella thionipta]MCU7966731.1 sulfurtransferase [gamma proteobacterium symbiont of Bathyaustriella thionipta]
MIKSFPLICLLSFSLTLITSMAYAEVSGIPTGFQIQEAAEKKTRKINTADLKIMLDEELDMILIDIRTAAEVQNMDGKIDAPQNVHIPRGWLEFRVQRVALNKDIPIVVYCGGGLRSPLAAETLQDMGYSNVKNYSEGFFAWKKSGLPVKP